MWRDKRAKVVPAVAHDWPTIITAGAKNIDLVTATRSLLRFPKISCLRINCEPMTVSVAQRKNSGLEARAVNKRVVGRNAPVVTKPHDLAGIIVWILRTPYLRRSWSANAHVEHAVTPKGNSRCFRFRGAGLEDIPHINERRSIPSGTRQNRFACTAASRPVVCEVHPLILGELRV